MQAFPLSAQFASRKHHVETSRREEEMGRVKGSGEGAGRESFFSLPSSFPFSFFRPRIYRKGYYFYSPQSSAVIKSKMAATTILRTRTRFRPPKIRLHCRLQESPVFEFVPVSCNQRSVSSRSHVNDCKNCKFVPA